MSFDQMEQFHTRPAKIIIAGLLVIGLFFGGLGGIAATMPFSGAIIAPGIVKVLDERKTVQHLEGGIVDRILVQEGDRVEKDQVLIRLKSSQVDSSVDMLSGMLFAKLATFDRLTAEKNMAKNIQWSDRLNQASGDPEVKTLMKKEEENFTSRRTALGSKLKINDARIRQLREKIEGIENELVSRKSIIDSLEQEISIKEPLLKENYIDQSELLLLDRQRHEHLSTIAVKNQIMAESMEQIKEIELSSLDLKNNFREQAVAELSQVNEAIFELEEKLRPRKDERERLVITAPVGGDVINLQVHSKDGVIRPGEPILDIVPKGAQLVIECRLRQDQITKVKPGQPTRIQLSAFNRITTAPIDGKIIYVSADTVTERTPQGEIPFYIIHVEPEKASLEENEAWLSAGMPAACFVETERRTFLQYLMEPIMLNIDRAARETL